MITFVVSVLLIIGFLIGLRRGLVLQVFHLLGFIIAFIVARMYYSKIASHLSLWIPYPELSGESSWAVFLNSMPLEDAFYNGISFVLVFTVAKVVVQIIATMLDFVANFPILKTVNKLLGAVFGFIEVYLITFVVLYITALIPVQQIQDKLKTSSLAINIVENTPIFSELMQSIWFTEITSPLLLLM